MNKTMLERMEAAYWRARKAGHGRNKCLRAVLEEMREPTEIMWQAGAFDPHYVIADAWRAMIDAALAEGETSA